MTCSMFLSRSKAYIAIVCILLITLCACDVIDIDNKVDGVSLDFETIARDRYSGTGTLYEDENSAVVIFSSAEEIDQLGQEISSNALTDIRNIDFDTEFGAIVFQGWKSSGGYSVQIQDVRFSSDGLYVYADFEEPAADQVTKAEITSPYHVIRVGEPDTFEGETNVVLIVNGEEVYRQIYVIK